LTGEADKQPHLVFFFLSFLLFLLLFNPSLSGWQRCRATHVATALTRTPIPFRISEPSPARVRNQESWAIGD
jgi:hypothetical protein